MCDPSSAALKEIDEEEKKEELTNGEEPRDPDKENSNSSDSNQAAPVKAKSEEEIKEFSSSSESEAKVETTKSARVYSDSLRQGLKNLS